MPSIRLPQHIDVAGLKFRETPQDFGREGEHVNHPVRFRAQQDDGKRERLVLFCCGSRLSTVRNKSNLPETAMRRRSLPLLMLAQPACGTVLTV